MVTVQLIIFHLQMNGTKVDHITLQMLISTRFWKAPLESFKLCRISCKLLVISSQLRVESFKHWDQSCELWVESFKHWDQSCELWMESFKL
jgi:hypothetical protein